MSGKRAFLNLLISIFLISGFLSCSKRKPIIYTGTIAGKIAARFHVDEDEVIGLVRQMYLPEQILRIYILKTATDRPLLDIVTLWREYEDWERIAGIVEISYETLEQETARLYREVTGKALEKEETLEKIEKETSTSLFGELTPPTTAQPEFPSSEESIFGPRR